MGVLGMLLILMKVCKLHAITSGRVTLGLDRDYTLKGAEYLVPSKLILIYFVKSTDFAMLFLSALHGTGHRTSRLYHRL